MGNSLSKRQSEILAMSDEDYFQWLHAISEDMEEAADRKGIRQYVVEDSLDAAESVGNKIAEVVDEYQQWKEAEQEADRAEARARQMEQRVRERRRQLGR